MHRVDRLAAVSSGLQKVLINHLPVSVSVRRPPYKARASPRPRSRAHQDVTFAFPCKLSFEKARSGLKANWWYKEFGGVIKQASDFPGIAVGPANVSLRTSRKSLLGKLIGGNYRSEFSFLCIARRLLICSRRRDCKHEVGQR
jgi:hypothetical protein